MNRKLILYRSLLMMCVCMLPSSLPARTIEGFTQPADTVNVAAPEAGIIQQLALRQGSAVKAGQVIAVLDNAVLQATLQAAQAKAESKGPLMAAEATFRQQASRRDHMLQLSDQGHASPEELDRAKSAAEIAEANLVTAREQAKANQLELKQIEAQIERRTIRSPIDGVITLLPKRRGEFVTASDATVATVVQIDQLRAIFHVPTEEVAALQPNDPINVKFAATGQIALAKLDFVSPITDAESNLVRVEVLIDNTNHPYRSGVRCFLQTADGADNLRSARGEKTIFNTPASHLR